MRGYVFFLLIIFSGICASAQPEPGKQDLRTEVLQKMSGWSVEELAPGGRIDAVRFLSDSIVVCGVRGKNRGKLFISKDKGVHWKLLHNIPGTDIACIAETADQNVFYLLTGNAAVLETRNGGRTWKKLATLTTNKNREGAMASYGIVCTTAGTLLVADTDSDGGHIYRSGDHGKTWKDLGIIGENGLYRFEKAGGAIVVNGFDGKIYRSVDDGLSWKMSAELSDAPLFATEYLEEDRLIQADKSGNIFRSDDGGIRWEHVTQLSGSADDFIHIRHGILYYSTYTGKREVYFSVDYGSNWFSLGTVPTQAEDDWLDHGVSHDAGDSILVIAATGKGFIMRNVFSKRWLKSVSEAMNGKNHVEEQGHKNMVIDTVQRFRYPRVNRGSTKNLVPNASFEAGKDGWSTQGTATGWGGDFWDLYGELDRRNALDGSYSLRIGLGKDKTPVTSFDSWPAERKLQLAPLVANKGWIDVIPGRPYTFSVYMRSDREGVPGLLKVFQAPDLNAAITPVTDTQIVRLNRKWTRYSLTVVALDKQMFVAAGPALDNNNTFTAVWVDALQLEQNTVATVFEGHDNVEIGLSTGRFGNIFQQNDNIALSLMGHNSGKQSASFSIHCSVTDYFDKVVWQSEKTIAMMPGRKAQLAWPVKLPGLGYYHFRLSWISGGSEHVREFPVAVIADYTAEDSPYGINHAPTAQQAGLTLQRAGIRWARNWSVNWGALEPEENRLSFGISDEQLERDQLLGFKTLSLLPLPSTNWNSAAPDSIPAEYWYRAAYLPKDTRALINFIDKAVRHYRKKVPVWEFLNEPVWTKFCLPGIHYGLPGANYGPEDYTRLLKLAYPAIKAADASATVIGGFSAEPWRYTKDFILSGGLEHVDILNIHNYGGFTAPEKFIPDMDSLLAYMDRYGKRKPIWITEYAYYAADDLPWLPWSPPANYSAANLLLKNERQCADWTVRYNVIMFARNVDKIFYHQGSAGPVNHNIVHLECPFFGDFAEPRKVYAAQSALANLLGASFSFSGTLSAEAGSQLSHSVQTYGFQSEGNSILVAWVSEEEKRKVTIALPDSAEIYNVMGNRINANGSIRLDQSPVYIVARSKDTAGFLRSCKLAIE